MSGGVDPFTREGSQVRSLHRPPCSPGKPPRFAGRQNPPQFRSVSGAQRGLRTEFRPFSRVLRLQSPASLCPQNSVSRTHEIERPEPEAERISDDDMEDPRVYAMIEEHVDAVNHALSL